MAVAHPAKAKWADVATVTLLVGETKTAFHVHEATLFKASSFFKAAFNSRFRESSDRTMTLPEEDVSIFELFVDWLYHQRYDIPSPPEKPSSDYDRYEQPVQLFVLADKYDVRNLKNRIISTMFLLNQQQVAPALDTVAYAYEHTPQNSTIRKLFAEYLRCTQAEWYQEASSQDWLRDHPEICTDIVVGYAKHREPGKFSYNEMPEEFIEKEEGSKE